MALYLDHQGLSPDHLHVVREAIELGCIQAVTSGGRTADVATRLRAVLDGSDDRGEPGEVFHAELAELAGNPVLTLFLRIVTELRARKSRTNRPPITPVVADVRLAHEKILDAVIDGDPGLAQLRMRRHLQALTLST
jgi:DNA-binding FadR family transcriptional regulator